MNSKRGSVAGVGGRHRYLTQQAADQNRTILWFLAGVAGVVVFAALAVVFSASSRTTDPNLLLLADPSQKHFLGLDSNRICTLVDFPPHPWQQHAGELSLLEPYISNTTIRFHFFQHQKGYVTKLNAWLVASQAARWPEHPSESVVTRLVRTLPQQTPQYRNAAQIFNHALYFAMLAAPKTETQRLTSSFDQAVKQSFGSRQELISAMKATAMQHFGSGWVWLLLNKTQGAATLTVIDTHDAVTPLAVGNTIVPLLVCDVWEHAYYLDRQNRRDEYFDSWATVVNWAKVSERFDAGVVETFGNRTYPDFEGSA